MNLRLCGVVDVGLAWLSTISTRISTAAWKRPGTPELALRAADPKTSNINMPIAALTKIESMLMTETNNNETLLDVLQVLQVVNDAFTGGWCVALLRPSDNSSLKYQSVRRTPGRASSAIQYVFIVITMPASNASQLSPAHQPGRRHNMATVKTIFTNSQPMSPAMAALADVRLTRHARAKQRRRHTTDKAP